MNGSIPTASQTAPAGSERARLPPPIHPPAVPAYLQQAYWWAYVHPNAVALFEREWLVSAILWGHYGTLRDAAIADLTSTADGKVSGRVLQIACAYGNLTPTLQRRLAPQAHLDVVDILSIQLGNLARKLIPDERITLLHGDASALALPDASYDSVLLFFLLHEQPEAVRRASLAEAMRVVRPGGKVVVVDYHRPVRWHLLRPLMRWVFRTLEPYAMDLWDHEVLHFMPAGMRPNTVNKQTYFGGLYQKLVLTR